MKSLILVFFFALSASAILAQSPPTVAMDFTADDCQGITHNLFSELDEGNVILMEFVMLDPCIACVKVRELLQPISSAFEASHPGRYKLYTIGWTNSITCADMEAWMDKHIFANIFFQGNGDMTDYYGGMGMPTVVLVAGKDHKVLYVSDVNNGFNKADTAIIRARIAEALTAAEVKPLILKDETAVYPNPATDIIRIASEAFGQVSILNALGQVVATRAIGVKGEIDVAQLTPGLYSILYAHGGLERRASFIKR